MIFGTYISWFINEIIAFILLMLCVVHISKSKDPIHRLLELICYIVTAGIFENIGVFGNVYYYSLDRVMMFGNVPSVNIALTDGAPYRQSYGYRIRGDFQSIASDAEHRDRLNEIIRELDEYIQNSDIQLVFTDGTSIPLSGGETVEADAEYGLVYVGYNIHRLSEDQNTTVAGLTPDHLLIGGMEYKLTSIGD